MRITKSFLLFAALASGTLARMHGHAGRHAHLNRRSGSPSSAAAASSPTPASSSSSNWLSTPVNGIFSTLGFGGSTSSSGSGDTYEGNVGNPWGSNIIEVSASDASQYKYVAQFTGSNTEPWTVVFWNKYGPDGKMDGWYGHSALSFTLQAGETKYVAFAEDSQGGWGAAPGSTLPTDKNGGYSCTWGEFDFGNTANNGWSGYDVSAIQAQAAGQTVQGMKICQAPSTDCSYITTNAGEVVNAYTQATASQGGIGGNIPAGPVRLTVQIDYNG
ncbi:hypothetical protein VTN77DRAFT_6534 [Rasamsonia byssochlamydoides]|uniref:uncharacterized protein n=1 Tax=Rasamsonia byssochlamydoides TaxID=89139 RepID=UPI0037421493